jgi:DHA1 family inner membrane transport protein
MTAQRALRRDLVQDQPIPTQKAPCLTEATLASPSSARRRACLLALGTFAIGTDAFIIAGILPNIAHSLAIGIESAGSIVSVFSLAYAVGSPIVSALTSQWRRSTAMVVGLTVFTFANFLSAISPNLAVLLLTRVLAAVSAGLAAPTAYAIASSLGTDRNRGKMLAIVAAGFTSAMVLGVPIGVLIGNRIGWRGSLAFVAVVGAIATLSIFLSEIPEPPGPRGRDTLPDRFKDMGRRRTLAVLLPFLIWSIANFQLYTFITPILEQHLAAAYVPAILLLFGVGAMAGNFVGGILADRFGPYRPAVACLCLLAIALCGFEVTGFLVVTATANMACWAISMAALFTLQQQRIIASNPGRASINLALNNSTLYLGAAIGAATGGTVIAGSSLAFVL